MANITLKDVKKSYGKLAVVQGLAADPADFLDPVVAADDAIANREFLDGALSSGRGDGGSGCEAGHNVLDVFEGEGADDIPLWIEELDDTVFGIVGIEDDVGGSLPPVAEVERVKAVSYTHLRAHETVLDLVCRLLLEKKNEKTKIKEY